MTPKISCSRTSPGPRPEAGLAVKTGSGHRRASRRCRWIQTCLPSYGHYPEQVRIATWNVNSVKQRVPRLLPWLDERRPDVVCLQETKLARRRVQGAARRRSSRSAATRSRCTARRSGTAWRSCRGWGWTTSRAASPDAPGFPHPEARAVSATCGGMRVHSVYAPNGRVPDSDHYHYKLAWFAALRERGRRRPGAAIVCGDMNIAPTDADVFDPHAYVGQTHVTPPERAALADAAGARAARRRARALAHRARVHVLGLPRRHVSQGPRHAHRPGAGQRAGRRPGEGGLGGPAGPQRHAAERSRAGDRRPGRGARRRHRAGGAAAIGARRPSAARSSCPSRLSSASQRRRCSSSARSAGFEVSASACASATRASAPGSRSSSARVACTSR